MKRGHTEDGILDAFVGDRTNNGKPFQRRNTWEDEEKDIRKRDRRKSRYRFHGKVNVILSQRKTEL